MSEKLKELQILLFKKQHSGRDNLDQEIVSLLEIIFIDLAKNNSYEDSLKDRNLLITILEEYQGFSSSVLIILIVNSLNELVNVTKNDIQFLLNYDENDTDYFMAWFQNILFDLSSKPSFRLSDSNVLKVNMEENKKIEFLSFLINLIQHSSSKLNSETKDIVFYYNTLSIINILSTDLGKNEYFYFTCAIIIDVLNIGREYQLGRDLGEEILYDSMKKGCTEFGYYNLLHVYAAQHNIVTSLVFAKILITRIIINKEITLDFLYKVLTTLQKFFRDIHLAKFEKNIFDFIKKYLELSTYQKHELFFIHFMSMLKEEDPNLVNEIIIFLSTERENLLSINPRDNATRWLTLLYNMKFVFKNTELQDIESFIALFERVITQEEVSYLKTLTFSDENLIELFIEVLISISKSRYSADATNEISNFVIIANRLIIKSYREQNPLDFLLAMLVKSDISFHFKEQENYPEGLRKIDKDIEDKEKEKKKVFFGNYQQYFKDSIRATEENIILLLAESESKVFQLTYGWNKFSEITLLEWDFSGLDSLIKNLTSLLKFDESNFIEDQEDNLKLIQDNLKSYKVCVEEGEILLIKDIKLSSLPHNLLLNSKLEFISLNYPITNILSTEWLINENKKGVKLIDVKPDVWIPTEGGDLALNSLNSKMEKLYKKYEITPHNSLTPETPLKNDINIIAAHGGPDIPNSNYIFSNGVPIGDFSKIVGRGKIMVLLVCHSGTMKKEFFSQKVNSFIRFFLDNGYSSIVAPYWSLNINIPPIWLPEFLNQLENGATVSVAVFNANKKVFEQYKDPGAWACMHLFGNPYLRFK